MEIRMNPARRLAPFLVLLVLCGLAAEPAVAAEVREQASKFVENLGHQVETLLGRNDGRALGQQQQAFATLVREGFDLEVIGRFALGRFWKSATAVQQLEYQKLFALWTISSYALLLGDDHRGNLTVIGARPLGGRDALVRTKIDQLNGTPIEIDLRVRATNGRMKIVEVLMAGASMGVTQRDEFASVIQHRGLDGLIRDLRGRVDNLQAEAARD
jgi:phospholipid transport system substrate-binding protein